MPLRYRIHPAVLRILVAAATLAFVAAPAAAQIARGSGGLPPRDEWQRVDDILAALRITDGHRVADIAAGQGYLTKPLAKKVGKSGIVYAVEISDEARRALAELAVRDSLTNVEIIVGTETDPKLPADLDGAVILNAYHEMTASKPMLEAIRRSLRPGALLVLVDNGVPPGHAPTREEQVRRHGIDPTFVDAELRAAGFDIVDRQDRFIVEPFSQWLIVARRPGP
ncbi:MAG TPA: methyltransferase domain-containing protein [Gemmatimonadaceae bacterium]|nr:methyltransferase domain-containing protein [Gemmatimonadaceae bacterium]